MKKLDLKKEGLPPWLPPVYLFPEFESGGIVPRMIAIVGKVHDDNFTLSPEIEEELKSCSSGHDLPFVLFTVVDGIAVPAPQYRPSVKPCKK